MKGRYEHGGIFDVQNIDTVPIDQDEKTDVYGKPKQTAEYIKRLPNPQFNSVKPGIPKFSFTQADRFFTKDPYPPKQNCEPYQLFEDNKYAPDDRKLFGKDLYMGVSNKGNFVRPNKNPGPGQYLIPGFADEIVRKAKHRDELRNKVEEKKQRMEEEKQAKKEEVGKIEVQSAEDGQAFDDKEQTSQKLNLGGLNVSDESGENKERSSNEI